MGKDAPSGPECPALQHSRHGHTPTPADSPGSQERVVSVALWSPRSPKFTTRCPSSFLSYICTIFCIGNTRSDRHQNSFGSQSEGLTKIIFRLLKLRAPGSQTSRTSSRQLRFRLGGGSVFGSHNPFLLLDLPVSRSEWPITGFGMSSVSVVDGKGHRESCYASSTNRLINKGNEGLIIPRSRDRVLAGIYYP